MAKLMAIRAAQAARIWTSRGKIGGYMPQSRDQQSTAQKKINGRIGCVGRIVPIKGQDILIAAMHWLWKNGNDKAQCVIAGDGPADYLEQLKTAAVAVMFFRISSVKSNSCVSMYVKSGNPRPFEATADHQLIQ
jgi:Glycosyl transferases group 1